jgi:D-amino-acid dehydrogenase
MKIVILGAGVVGVTTAYFLAREGHNVEVIEQNSQAAMETSFANGGQLSYSHAEPWANPAVLPKIAKWLFREDAPLVFRPNLDWRMYEWGLRFLANCTTRAAHNNALAILNLALYSKKCLSEIKSETGVKFDNRENGILHIFAKEAGMEAAIEQSKFQSDNADCPYKVLNLPECLAMEPALKSTERHIIGGIHFPYDESGDVHMFTRNLAEYCQKKYSTTFLWGQKVVRLETAKGSVSAVVTESGSRITADRYVTTLGPGTAAFMRDIGVKLAIYPMKGYSITVPVGAGDVSPEMSITDSEYKIVYSRLGNRLRVAGTAEFSGYSKEIRNSRINPIINEARELFPRGGDYANAEPWAGLRPATPSGVPYISRTKYDNLLVNSGHGTLGWTMSAGSGKMLCDIIMERKTALEQASYKVI